MYHDRYVFLIKSVYIFLGISQFRAQFLARTSDEGTTYGGTIPRLNERRTKDALPWQPCPCLACRRVARKRLRRGSNGACTCLKRIRQTRAIPRSSDDGRLLTSHLAGNIRDLSGQRDQVGQSLLRVGAVLRRIRLVAFDIDTQRGAAVPVPESR